MITLPTRACRAVGGQRRGAWEAGEEGGEKVMREDDGVQRARGGGGVAARAPLKSGVCGT